MISTIFSVFLLLVSGFPEPDSVKAQNDRSLIIEQLHTQIYLRVSPYHHSLRLAPQVVGQLDVSSKFERFSQTPLVSIGFQNKIGQISIGYTFSSTLPFRPGLSIYNRDGDSIGEGIYSIWNHDARVGFQLDYGITLGAGYHQFTSRIREFKSNSTTPFGYELTDHSNLYVTAAKIFQFNRLTIAPSLKYSLRQWMDSAPDQYIRRSGSSSVANNGKMAITSPARFYSVKLQIYHEALGPIRMSISYELFDHSMMNLTQTMFTLSYHHLFKWLGR